MKTKIFLFAASLALLASCDDVFEPAIENHKTLEQMYTDPEYAQGFLLTPYRTVPGCYDNSEYATDDAVQNQASDAFMTIATGGWTSQTWTSLNQWTNAYNGIQYLNLFLENADKVDWTIDKSVAPLFTRRMKGEAYGLRGMYLYYLLRAHAGYDESGNLLGVLINNKSLGVSDDFNRPRASFKECLDSVYADLDRAVKMLPEEYIEESQVPAAYRDLTSDVAAYNRACGKNFRQLFNGLIARAFKARMAILAASPAYLNGEGNSWQNAAQFAAAVIKYNGGVAGLAKDGIEYYAAATADNVQEGQNPKEIIWRENTGTNNSQESDFFPPSLFGKGKMNPSQNLVDAFPMANGFPIASAESGYDTKNPYAGRDPRLSKYIIYNGAPEGVSNTAIMTSPESGTNDGLNRVEYKSTRTGYYMKKRLRMDVNCNPTSSSTKPHYTPRIRYTEMYLDYAEAANEAYGPKVDGCGAGFTAYDVIKAIRQRAGVGGSDDPYLEQCAASKDAMRQLIQNERRLELCFEGFRFWDLRRWNMPLNETVRGISWSADGSSYQIIDVEKRDYQDYMRYCPIPYSETLKYNQLQQNKGWK